MELSGMNWLRAAVVALVTVAGGALAAEPPLPPGLSAPKTATKLPLFSLPLVGGGSARAEELRGKVIVARFWATW